MGVIDRFWAAVSPRHACEREAWRQQLEVLRSYDAAGFGRLNAGWRVHNESAELTDRNSRDVVRARARDLERNSDIAQAILYAYTRNVVGKGYTLRAKTGDETLNKEIERAWKHWCKARNCDVTGEQSFNQMLRMAVDRKKVDGGLLAAGKSSDDLGGRGDADVFSGGHAAGTGAGSGRLPDFLRPVSGHLYGGEPLFPQL